MSNLDVDPIPTGRPPVTPVLKAKNKDSYFPPAIEPEQFQDYQKSMDQIKSEQSDAELPVKQSIENPFDDAAAVQEDKSFSSGGTTHALESSNDRKLASLKSSTDRSNSTWGTLYEEDEDRELKIKEVNSSSGPSFAANNDSVINLPTKSPTDPTAQPGSPTLALLPSHPTDDRRQADIGQASLKSNSLWSLQSRERDEGRDADDSSSSDADVNEARRRQRSQKRTPTHEDIRRQFRTSRTQTPAGLRQDSSSSTDSGLECEASFGKASNEGWSWCFVGGTQHRAHECNHTRNNTEVSGAAKQLSEDVNADPPKVR